MPHQPSGGRREGRSHLNSAFAVAPMQNPNPGFPFFPPFYAQPNWNFPHAAAHLSPAIPQLSPFFQSPNLVPPQPAYAHQSQVNYGGSSQGAPFERAETALEKAHCEVLAAGENVSAWKVSQAALVSLQVDSWASLGFQFQDIPYLRRLVAIEGKVNAFIHCYIGVWRIASLHDLEIAICKNEGIEQFDALRLGPLLRHPLVSHYFSIPHDTNEVPKINVEEIISHLSFYLDKVKQVVVPEEFLDFLADKYGVSCKEKLGVRIHSLGLHIAYIRDAKRAENLTRSKRLEDTKTCKGESEGRQWAQPPNMLSEKRILDRRFGFISKRIKSFSSACDDFQGKHIKFDPSSDDDGENESKSRYHGSPQSNNDVLQRISSCPYPSTTEEKKRLGLQTEIEAKSTSSSKKSQSKIDKISARKRKYEMIKMKIDEHATLDRSTMQKFVTRWKEACGRLSTFEVLRRMLNFYKPDNKLRKKGSRSFYRYPGIALLNIAITSIRCGITESFYDVFDNVIPDFDGQTSTEGIELELPEENDDQSETVVYMRKLVSSITDGDILQKIVHYFEAIYPKKYVDQPMKNEIGVLRRFHDCKTWLENEFHVDEFYSLGCGSLVEFLERNFDRIPVEVWSYFSKDPSRGFIVVNPQQFDTFLSQAQNNSGDLGVESQRYVLLLLQKQFPTIRLDLISESGGFPFQDTVKRQGDSGVSNCIYYSAALLGKFCSEKLNISPGSNSMCTESEVDYEGDHVSAKDAIECLLKVPMLSDLRSWTHWDIAFGPKFGPLLPWLSKQIQNDEISCVALSDGRLIRIDNSATIDEYLEASVHCSPFNATLKLLSILALYRGIHNLPVSLLKCYTEKAIDSLIGCSREPQSFNPALHFPIYDSGDDSSYDGAGEIRCRSGANIAAKFVLDCLEQMPSEFHSFAADILMSGLRCSIKDAPRIMLQECKRTEQRTMLHGIGLSLGIVEWIEDYNYFKSEISALSFAPSRDPCKILVTAFPVNKEDVGDFSARSAAIKSDMNVVYSDLQVGKTAVESSNDISIVDDDIESEEKMNMDAAVVVESIRRDEFGLDPSSSCSDSSLLKKQHARLGRALYCLSHELYSQDSHLLLELVQNADDNTYPEVNEPTLVFILEADAIVILNNERGFSAENIKALCDIGNSTKRGSSAGYIGHKGIGFKSVFRVTDAPEIHSNGFHVKFDVSEGPIGFVLPTVIPPRDTGLYGREISSELGRDDALCWNTCIVLPFRSKLKQRSGTSSIKSMFSDLHPSLLLFLHRLECIMFKNTLNGSLVVMKKQSLGDGMVKVSYGKEKMNWLVVRQNLRATVSRPGVQTTEIALAFTLHETDSGEYEPYLTQQPAFAFLPLRTYGLKFIIQGDFILPSSREEIDGNSAWNQWLLSEFPLLFVNAEARFVALPCFRKCPGKAVSAFMSFVPKAGEVHGFFSHLPQMIVSKLRASRCLLLDGGEIEWVLPCKVLRGWDEKARTLLSDGLLHRHLDLGFLDRHIMLSDSLAKALGVRDYGPKVLTDVLSSVCQDRNGVKELGFSWLFNWVVAISSALSHSSAEYQLQNAGTEAEVIEELHRIPFIPLADGSYGSIAEGPIWLPGVMFGAGFENMRDLHFPRLYAKLRMVNPDFLSLGHDNREDESKTDTIVRFLQKFGVQQLSVHDVIVSHILPAVSATQCSKEEDKDLLVEYLSYVMLHFQNACSNCLTQRNRIISDLQKSRIVLSSNGCKCPAEGPLHFSTEFGNPFKIDKLIESNDNKWILVDDIYLKHYSIGSSAPMLIEWRKFFRELGVSDFVQVVRVEKQVKDLETTTGGSLPNDFSSESQFIAWESPELVQFLSTFSSTKQREKCKYLLEILDKTWDELSFEAESYAKAVSVDGKHAQRLLFLRCIHDFRWIGSTTGNELHYPKDIFHDCEEVRSILGSFALYANLQVKNKKLLGALGFKTMVTYEDALAAVRVFATTQSPCLSSTEQMTKLYHLIWEAVTAGKVNLPDCFQSSPLIFVPSSCESTISHAVQSGSFLSSNHAYWWDPTGCVDKAEKMLGNSILSPSHAILCKIYPNLHEFFVNICSVSETPSSGNYVDIMLKLSKAILPAQAAHLVFQVFIKWSDDLISGSMDDEEISLLRKSLRNLENTVLPTMLDKWVSLHPSFGIICWSDNNELQEQFTDTPNINFIHFGELSGHDQEILSKKVSVLLQKLGVVALSEIVSREAIFYGTEDGTEKASLINWVLPYAQRYLLKLYPNKYEALKKNWTERVPLLRIVTVDKLFFKYRIRVSDGTSRKRYECCCLLQDNVLYITCLSDSHSIFLELSRLFFSGSAELHFANFLHMITTMAESGSTEEQIEIFILNSQKVLALPAAEPVWTLSPSLSSSLSQGVLCARSSYTPSLAITPQQSTLPIWRKAGIAINWPPTDWKTAPDFSGGHHFGANSRPSLLVTPSSEDISSLMETGANWSVTEELEEESAAGPAKTEDSSCQHDAANSVHRTMVASSITESDDVALCFGGLGNSQSRRTGALGEAIAFKYLREKYSAVSVKWVNEGGETGLPYDLIIEDNGRREFVEVKATRSAMKDWFAITTREWQFAVEKGDCYTIAYITLAGPKSAKVVLLKNPLKLCQQSVLNLALLLRKP
ncbi:histidine kinase-, DNA gyrase B-, and HSP90-like ATPase family protein [Wolffia australiana]